MKNREEFEQYVRGLAEKSLRQSRRNKRKYAGPHSVSEAARRREYALLWLFI